MSVFVMLVAERKVFENYRHTIICYSDLILLLGMEVIGGSWLSDLTARINTYGDGERTKYSENVELWANTSADFGGRLGQLL